VCEREGGREEREREGEGGREEREREGERRRDGDVVDASAGAGGRGEVVNG
jgi:hypothetical protein